MDPGPLALGPSAGDGSGGLFAARRSDDAASAGAGSGPPARMPTVGGC